jgi:hypothetical protein
MPTAQTQTEPSHVHANLALLAPELLVLMLTSVPQTPITVIQMLTAQTRMERLPVLANLALLAPEQLALM